MEPKRALINRMDFWLIAGLLGLAALLLGLWYRAGQKAESLEYVIIVDGSAVLTAPLDGEWDKPEKFSIPQRPQMAFILENAAIGFEKSDCPDQICVHTGKINRAGQSAACLPNGVIIRIQTRQGLLPDEIDAVLP